MKKKIFALLTAAFLIPVIVMAYEAAQPRWYDNALAFAAQYGMLDADEYGSLQPDAPVTRVAFARAIWMYEGQPDAQFTRMFYDVEADAPYYDVVQWITSMGIITGVGGSYFAPHEGLTRQQIAVILYRYAMYFTAAFASGGTDALAFYDYEYVREYAESAVRFVVENGFMRGRQAGYFAPSAPATRAEAVVALYNFIQALPTLELTAFFEADFTLPMGITVDNDGNLVVFDTFNAAVRRIRNNRAETIIAGADILDEFGFTMPFHVDGTRENALLGRPTAGVFARNGDLFIVDSANNAIRRLRGDNVTTFAPYAGLNQPSAIAIDRNGNLFVADTLNHVIRRISSAGSVTTVAGVMGEYGHNDGAANQALFLEPAGIAVAPNGDIFVADTGNHVIRRISGGTVTTVAGALTPFAEDAYYRSGGFADGAAAGALFYFPRGLYYVGGELFIADAGNHAIRLFTGGAVYTLAGNGEPGMLNQPVDVVYFNGVLYIVDSLNHAIRAILLGE
ncbi:MAG: S-layer homology domain-containing protein [Defluviitaleaceae bacterium]|nr:S-layer homology domain-containing protein [Defluviitaleaceae bacterium]MCL2275268.1 S-layer homology domain-containing protein [Defluviitaleaceae bacterium]